MASIESKEEGLIAALFDSQDSAGCYYLCSGLVAFLTFDWIIEPFLEFGRVGTFANYFAARSLFIGRQVVLCIVLPNTSSY